MSKIGLWSTTPGSNSSTPPDGWPEGQAPSTVNDCAREMMAQIRALILDAQFIDQGMTPTYISTTTFSLAGNQTSAIHADRRLKMFDATAGASTVIYATVVTASFTVVTTVQISADAGQLTSSLSSFAVSILAKNNDAIPRNLTVASVSGNSYSSMGVTQTLSVGGVTRLDGALSVAGAATFKSGISISGASQCSGAFSFGASIVVAGQTSLNAGLSVAGSTVMRALSVTGVTVHTSATTVNGQFIVQNVANAVSIASHPEWQSFLQGQSGQVATVMFGQGVGGTAASLVIDNPGNLAAFYYNVVTLGLVGQISTNGTATTYGSASDYRLKENVSNLTSVSTWFKRLRPVTFNWKSDPTKLRESGFIAHEVQEVVPSAVVGEKDGKQNQMLDQSKLIPLLTSVLQEALGRIEALEDRIRSFPGG